MAAPFARGGVTLEASTTTLGGFRSSSTSAPSGTDS